MKRFLDAFGKIWRERRLARRIARARRRPSVERIQRLAIRLIARGQFDEAETLVELGLEQAPDSPELLEQLAYCAHNSGRYREALERWRRLCALRPDLPMSWCGIAANARELRLVDEAASAVEEALRRFPDDIVVLTETARLREHCGNHAEAAELWRRVLPHHHADADWHLALARNLLALQRYDEAEEILVALQAPLDRGSAQARRAAARQWCALAEGAAKSNRALLVRHAAEAVPRFGEEAFAVRQVAETTPELEAARVALARLVERAPSDTEARDSYVRVLLRSDLVEDAERQVKIGSGLAPDDEGLHALQGLIAIRKHDWETAYACATALAEKSPDDFTAAYMLDRIRRVRQDEEATTTRHAARPVPIAPALCDEPETRQLLLGFESFGQDCEFGTVQRRYGAEPLGLLRWTDTNVPSLMAALAARFEGMGDPDKTELIVGEVGEIQVRDTRWHLAMHTFLYEHEVSLAVFHPKMCRRTAYLRDKLLEELRVGEKTIVFKSDLADAGDLLALHDTLSAFGPNRLLNVRRAAGSRDLPPGEPGSVREIRAGLFVGYLSRVANLADLAFDEWVEVCRGVEGLRAESAARPSRGVASAA